MVKRDTICALSTPPGIGGIAVIRVSGPDAIAIADRCFAGKKKLNTVPSHTIHYGQFHNDGELIDFVTASVYRAPHSYTGEDVVEFGSHGGIFVPQRILDTLVSKGARLAEPGEFTQRAFLNGKLDLTQVEAIADLIHAQSIPGVQAAARQLQGGLTRKFQELRQKLIDAAALLELELDFSDEDVEFVDKSQILNLLSSIQSACTELAASVVSSEILRGGYVISIAGHPNAGKSSLLNALLGRKRAIVSETPGTTRDYIEEVLFLEGITMRLIDTAGIRPDPSDRIEFEGIELAHSVLEQSNVILVINDASLSYHNSDVLLESLYQKFPSPHYVLVHNKLDIVENIPEPFPHPPFAHVHGISAKNGTGLQSLKSLLSQLAKNDTQRVTDGLINERQASLLRQAANHLQSAIENLRKNMPNECIALDIRSALDAIGKITGEVYTDEILQSIFSRFCIGK